jgi:hypothetical protein
MSASPNTYTAAEVDLIVEQSNIEDLEINLSQLSLESTDETDDEQSTLKRKREFLEVDYKIGAVAYWNSGISLKLHHI